jgi:hypothetical protein
MNNQDLIENVDFYYEIINGFKYKVFTEHYHLKRGFCCGNGCKNCPYKKKNNDINKK